MRRLARLLVPFVLLVPAAAACGDSGGGDGDTQSIAAIDIVARAAEATVDATTAKLNMIVELRGLPGQGDVTMTVDGAMDFEHKLAAMTMNLGDLGLPVQGEMEMRMDDTTMYMRMPMPEEAAGELGGKPWIKIDLAEAGRLTGVDPTQQAWSDPRQTLAMLEGVSGGVEEVGHEEVRGVDTTHYRAEVDLRQAARQSGAIVDEEMFDQFVDRLGVGAVPVDVWIDGDNQVRRMRMDMPMPAELGADVGATVTMEFFDFGSPVEISPPPPDQVTDMSALMGGFGEN